jgi:Uma2 family endonuclease
MAVATDLEVDLAQMLPATFTKKGLTETEYFALCAKFDNAFVEYTADGTVMLMPGTDPETSRCESEALRQLGNWAAEDGRGFVTGPAGSFLFPNGARMEPDVAWFDHERWKAAQAREPGKRVPVFAPEFVIEVRSPEQRARTQREKMEEYIANGVVLGWLISLTRTTHSLCACDPQERKVTIYRPGREPEMLVNPAEVVGEGPVAGFVLRCNRVFVE